MIFKAGDLAAIRKKYVRGASLELLGLEHNCTPNAIRKIVVGGGGEIRGRGRPPRRTNISPVLSEKLTLLSEILGKPINEDVLKTVVMYALRQNDGRTFRKIDRRYNYHGALSAFRRDHLECSYYIMGRLWRYVYRAVQQPRIQAPDYGLAHEDTKLCMSVVDDEARSKIIKWVTEVGDYVRLPNEDGVNQVVQDCMQAINFIVGRQLRFVYQYDPAYEREDLVSYLTVVAYRVAIRYDWGIKDGVFDYVKCLNYTKRSLWHAALLVIKENTGDRYRRLENVGTEERLYRVTTISLETPQDDDWLAIESKLGEDPDTTLEVEDLIKNVTDVRLQEFLKLEVEDNPAFTAFVLQETGKEENSLYTSDYAKWRELAQHFSGILTRRDRGGVKWQVLQELGMWDESRVRAQA